MAVKKKAVKEVAEEVKINEDIEVIEEVVENVKKEEVVKKTKQAIRFDPNEEVQVVSLNPRGTLIFEDHEHTIFEWKNFGDDNWISIKGLLHMRNRHRGFFTTPLVRVDEDVAEFLKIDVMYQDLVDLDNIDAIFEMGNTEFKKLIIKIPNGIREIIASFAIEKFADGTLDSMQKIRIIEEICKIEITDKSERTFIVDKK